MHRHRFFPAQAVACVFALCTALLATSTLQASVNVQTNDGRTLKGEIDSRTDSDHLWLRRKENQIVLTTSIRWSTIVSAAIDGQAIQPSALHQRAQEMATPDTKILLANYLVAEPPIVNNSSCPSCPGGRCSDVASIEIQAFLVNRDRDVPPDGLELRVVAIDLHGVPVPVKGSLYARLWGERDSSEGSLIRFEDLQRWSKPVSQQDFVEGVASYFLPFRTVHPARDLGLRPEALVNVRLGVFGQGNFEASVPIAIRYFNPVRDRHQYFEGSRYLRDELTEATHHGRARPVVFDQTTWSP